MHPYDAPCDATRDAPRDADIIALYWERNERAIRETADRYGSLCMRVAMNILSNSADAELLCDPAHQKTLAKAIAAGVHSYFNGVNVLD